MVFNKRTCKNLLGMFDEEMDSVCVNMPLIWRENVVGCDCDKSIKKFIREFESTFVHENIHRLIYHEKVKNRKFYKRKHKTYSDLGEEFVVRKVNGEVRTSFGKFSKKPTIKKTYSSKIMNYY